MRSWEFVNVSIQSDLVFLIAGMMRNVLGILLLSHVVGCFWYGLVSSKEGDVVSGYEALPTMWSRYAWAVHWATMQFTGLGLHALPHLDNPAEVIYSISSMFFTFVISASFVSIITTSMTRYHITNDQNLVQFAMLRKYLVDNNISARLSMRMQQNAHHVVAERNRFVPESDIELLELISDPLRVELHYELHEPKLAVHPFFEQYAEKYPAAIRQVCHQSVLKMSFFAGDLIFGDGEKPALPRMFFILSGKLEYSSLDGVVKEVLYKDQQISEANLWTDWIHQGTLKVINECRILVLDSSSFQQIAVQFRAGSFPPEIYARQFVDSLNLSEDHLTDVISEKQTQMMVKRAFGTNEKRNKRAMSSFVGSRLSSDRRSGQSQGSTRHSSWLSGRGSYPMGANASTISSNKVGVHGVPIGDGNMIRGSGFTVDSVLPGTPNREISVYHSADGTCSEAMDAVGSASRLTPGIGDPSTNNVGTKDRPSRVSFAFGNAR